MGSLVSAGKAASVSAGAGGRRVGKGTRLVGRYRLERWLGERGEATVWKAADEVLTRPVTVFTMVPGSPCAERAAAAARAASGISDPRLSRIFDADDQAHPAYIVTEWPAGMSLGELAAAGPLAPSQAARVIAEAAEAVAAAHKAGLAHLCLTPGSLWCSTRGEVKITGLAIDAALSGARAGEPAQADTRGLARLLYAALTGYWPGPGPGRTGLPPAPGSGERPRSPRELRPDTPAGADAVTCRALFGEASEGQPPILTPARLAAELSAITPPGPPPITAPPLPVTATLPLSLTTARPPPFLAVPAPAPARPGATARPGPPAVAGAGLTARPGRTRRWKLAAVLVTLAIAAAGGWQVARELTAAHPPAAANGPRPAPLEVRVTPVRATAFGPGGEADGDNSQLAPLVIDAGPASAWHTDWYTTATFGNLQAGTGLLLDLGHRARLTRAQLALGSIRGADLQLRAGDMPTLAGLRPVARAAGVGGTVRLRLSTPARARYVLIWFTRLPPDDSGTFQASVCDVRLDALRGHR